MRIGVRETQDLIRRVAADSQKEVARPVHIEPQEAGMATGPRTRRRSFLRPGKVPDYVSPIAAGVEDWQRLDDDVYKLLHYRQAQFAASPNPPSHQFIMDVEGRLAGGRRDYDPGTYLGLVRLAADLDKTRTTLVTASESGSLNALVRRITTGHREGEIFNSEQVSGLLRLLQSGDPLVGRGMADLLRFMARAARLPLLGNVQEAPALCLSTFLETVDLAARVNQAGQGKLEFRVSPLDVFLAARSVLFNRSVGNPTFSMIRELALDPSGLYHEDLQEWLQNVGLFGSDLTVLLPPRLSEEGFALRGHNFSALELVSEGGARLGQSPSFAESGLHTISDALVYRIQRQDLHKDHQIQTLLQHFNHLLRNERRSAARVQEDRRDARFDYMHAIRMAGEAAREAATGSFPVLKPRGGEQPEMAYEKSETGFSPPTRGQLKEWDASLQSIRKRLGAKSPVFRALVTQLARARGLDAALAFGLTPGGSRCLGRFMRLLQNEEMRRLFPLSSEAWDRLESEVEDKPASFLADFESLVLALYGFRGGLEDVQFRYRDRLRPEIEAQEDMGLLGEGSAHDESLIGLLVGVLLLEMGLFPGATAPGSVGRPDPMLGYAVFLRIVTTRTGQLSRSDLETARRLLWGMPADSVATWSRHRVRLAELLPESELPDLGAAKTRPGWKEGCEGGFMEEIGKIAADTGSEFDQRLLLGLAEIQTFLDGAIVATEKDKLRLARERLRVALSRRIEEEPGV